MSIKRVYYLPIKRGFAGFNHSCNPLAAAIEIMAVFPEPPAPYNTNGIVDSPQI